MNKGVFIDLNGTIVLPLKQETLNEMTLIPNADKAIKRLIDNNYICPIVTVQSRIEKGLFTEDQFIEWFNNFFKAMNLDVKGPYICPHLFSYRCECEKPNTYLYEKAAKDFNIDLKRSYTIGDSPQDVEAAYNFGGKGCLVKTGWAAKSNLLEDGKKHASYICDTIYEASEWIVNDK